MPVESVARPLHHPIFADLTDEPDEPAFGDVPPVLGRSSEQHPRALFADGPDPYFENLFWQRIWATDAYGGEFEVAGDCLFVFAM